MLRLTLLLTSCFVLSTSTRALPLKTPQATPQLYYLKTCVTSGMPDSGTDKEGLYVAGFHTGAGLGAATLTSDIAVADKGFLNGTTWQFDYGTPFPWYMLLPVDSDYAGQSSRISLCHAWFSSTSIRVRLTWLQLGNMSRLILLMDQQQASR